MTNAPSGLKSKTIYVVYGWLIILTAFEVTLVVINVPHAAGAILLSASTVSKAFLILLYFMHMKYDGWLAWLLPGIPVFLAILFTLALFPDVVYHLALHF